MGKSYPTVSEEYKKAIDKAKRKLRGFIAEKACAPLMLRIAYVSLSLCSLCVFVRVRFDCVWSGADGILLVPTIRKQRPEAHSEL